MEQASPLGKLKVNQKIWILSKLRYNISLSILKIVYHSLFGSYLQYDFKLWGQGNRVNQNNIQKLQNRALRKNTFKKLHDFVYPLYKNLRIFIFKKPHHLQNCLFVYQIEQNLTLAKSFVTFKHCGDNRNYQTRRSTKRILDIKLYKTEHSWYSLCKI